MVEPTADPSRKLYLLIGVAAHRLADREGLASRRYQINRADEAIEPA